MDKLKIIRQATYVGAVCNIFLACIKIFVGTIAKSNALVADGIHSFSDLITDLAIILGSKIWTAPADRNHPYGHGRFETLTNIFIGTLLFCVAIGMGWKAFSSLIDGEVSSPGMLAFWVAVLSILIKEILYRWTVVQAKKVHSKALYANAWHHRSDALSSLPVAIAVIVNYFYPELTIVDPIATLIVSAMIIKAAYSIVMPSFQELTETAMNTDVIEKEICTYATAQSNIKEVHNIRVRRMGHDLFIDFHLLVEPNYTIVQAHDIAKKTKSYLMEHNKNIFDILIHLEPDNEEERKRKPDGCACGCS